MLDLLEEFRSILAALHAAGVEYAVCGGLAVAIHRLSKPDPETGDLLSVDFLRVTAELEPAWEGRERVSWQHGDVTVVSRAGLVAMKRLRGSGQDLDDIRDLEASDAER